MLRADAAALHSAQQVDDTLLRAFEIRHEDTREALRLNRAAHAAALQLGHERGVAYALLRIALCLVILGEQEAESERSLSLAHSMLQAQHDLHGQAEVFNLLAVCSRRRGDHASALAADRQCLALRERSGDVVGQASSLSNMALSLHDLGQSADALETLFRSLALLEATGDARGQAYALANVGLVLLETDDPSQAVEPLQRSLALLAHTRDRAAESSTRTKLGQACLRAGDLDQAVQQLEQACSLSHKTGNRSDLAGAQAALGEALQARGDLVRSHTLLTQSLQTWEPTGDLGAQAEVMCLLGRNQALRADHGSALMTLQRALHMAQGAQAERAAALAHEALALVLEATGQFEQALAHHRAFHQCQQRLQSQGERRRMRELLMRARLEPLQRDVDAQRQRSHALANELDEVRRLGQERDALLAQVQRQAEQLEQLAREDGLTGVANRRWLDQHLARECERARRFGHPLTVAMIDIDHFKSINDQHSHAVGDAVLRHVARLLRDSCRTSDEVGRYGGEEFMLVLAETGPENAAVLCEKLCRLVQAHDWAAVAPGLAAVTISIGVAGTPQDAQPLVLSAAADAQLYRAKREGRNRVCR